MPEATDAEVIQDDGSNGFRRHSSFHIKIVSFRHMEVMYIYVPTNNKFHKIYDELYMRAQLSLLPL